MHTTKISRQTQRVSFNGCYVGKGDSEPNTDTLTAISEFFNVSVDYLLGKEEKTPTIDEQMNDIEFALYGEVKDLTDEQKQEILDFVKFKKLQEKFGEK